MVILGELSNYADPKPGQEVVTTGFSQYFPADVLIGWVESASLNETRTAYTVRVRLAAEMSRLNEVVLVGNRDFYEIRNLQQSEQIEQHTRTTKCTAHYHISDFSRRWRCFRFSCSTT